MLVQCYKPPGLILSTGGAVNGGRRLWYHFRKSVLLWPEPRFLGFLGRRGDCDACFGLGLDLAADGHGDLLVTDPEAHRWVSLKAGGQ